MSIIKKIKKVARILCATVAVLFFGIIIFANSGAMDFYKDDATVRAEFQIANLPQPIIDSLPVKGKEGKVVRTLLTPNTNAEYFVMGLHGSPGSGADYLEYLKDTTLTSIAQVATLDRAGFGGSNKGEAEPSLAEQVKYVETVLDKYAQGKKIIVVGHSLGGPLSARVAMDLGDRISGVVMVAASNSSKLEPNEWYRPMMNWALVKWAIPSAFQMSNDEIMPLRGELDKMLPLWKTIDCPVVIVQGDADFLVTMKNAAFTKEQLQHNPNVKVDMLKGGSHFILWSEQERIVRHIIEMIASWK